MLKSPPGNDAPGQPANIIRMVPGQLNTTLDPSALSQNQASDVRNCNTSRGVWQIDRRYRRFKTKPTRTYVSGAITDYTTAEVAPAAVTAVARTGGDRTFTSVSSSRLSDDAYASAINMLPGNKTELLQAGGFTPGVTVPTSATGLLARIRIESQIDPDTGFPCDVVDDYVYLTLSGTPVGINLATLTPVEITDTYQTYEVDLDALSITPADVNGGLLGVRAGWRSDPDAADAYDASNWSLAVTPTGTKGIPDTTMTAWAGASPWGVSGPGATAHSDGTVAVVATYIGSGSTPSYVILSTVTSASGATTATLLDDGQGGTYGPGVAATITHTLRRRVNEGAGYTVTLHAQASADAGPES